MKKQIVGFVIGLTLGFSLAFPKLITAYGEQTGPWSEIEKRQILTLLEQIESNTR